MWSVVRIHRGRLRENFRAVCAAAGPGAAVLPVIKDDAYGHGALAVARTLAGAGARQFAVASAGEAVTLRRAGITEDLLILCGLQPGEEPVGAEFNLIPMVQTLDQLSRWQKQARSSGAILPYHLEIDSGMTRLGFDAARGAETAAAVKAADALRLMGLATHFASPQDFSSRQTERQLDMFRKAVDELAAEEVRPPLIHMANSAALAYRPEMTAQMVRPGMALYGYVSPAQGPAPASRLRLRPALEWSALILSVRDVPRGALLGYGGTYRAPEPMRVGVVGVGYGHGFDCRLANGGEVMVGGRRCGVIGSVSMDITLIDLRPVPEAAAGDDVILIGDDLDAQTMARRCQTIVYEIFCGISPRVPREHVGDQRPATSPEDIVM